MCGSRTSLYRTTAEWRFHVVFTPFSSVLKICLSGAPIIYKYKYIHVCRGIISSDNLWTYRLGLHAHPSAQQLDDLETDDQ